MGPSPQSRALSWPRHDHDLGLDCDVVVVVIMGYDSVYYQYMPWRAAGCALSCAAGLVYCLPHVLPWAVLTTSPVYLMCVLVCGCMCACVGACM